MNQEQRKALLVCLVIVIGSYIVHSIVISASRLAHYQRAPHPVAAPKPTPFQPSAALPVADPSGMPLNLPGFWKGAGTTDRGMCGLIIELRPPDAGTYAAYTTITCRLLSAFNDTSKQNFAQVVLSQPKAVPSILVGKVEKGAIKFTVANSIAADYDGCAISGLTLTPFQTGTLAATWEMGSCKGGYLRLGRGR